MHTADGERYVVGSGNGCDKLQVYLCEKSGPCEPFKHSQLELDPYLAVRLGDAMQKVGLEMIRYLEADGQSDEGEK